jgi:Fusaric acid resistance protein-like
VPRPAVRSRTHTRHPSRTPRRTPPPWLAHVLRAQRGPVPWSAVTRGALAGGPLLLAGVLAHHTGVGIAAAIAAMFAGINDRPGSRRAAVRRIGAPALAGVAGLLLGTYAGQYLGAVPLTLLLTAVALVAGSVIAVGPVASGAGTQLLALSAVGAGLPLPEPGWLRALAFLGGAGWLLLLRLALPSPRAIGRDYLLDGERDAVAGVYDVIAALLDAAGTDAAVARRTALTAALDHAQDALTGPRLRFWASSAAERRLHAQYTAALPLAEAATALAWAGESVSERAAQAPRRLAAAVRGSTGTGPLPAPGRSAPALRALDDALLRAAETFDRAEGGGHRLHERRRGTADRFRAALGSGGREYGFRVALSFGTAVAIAQVLRHAHWYGNQPHQHWYWLPATAVFLVKPDLGPLASRVLCRAAGTVLGALGFAALAAVLPQPAGVILLVTVSGALLPVATRHFAAQTAVVTVLVLALVMAGGEPQPAVGRVGETLLACAIVLIVGHLPVPGQRGGGVRARLTTAGTAAHVYLAHVLAEPGTSGMSATSPGPGTADGRAAHGDHQEPQDREESRKRAERWALRREAYRTLAEARAAIALASAELPALARHAAGTDEIAALLETLVDTTTACAVHLDDTGRLTPRHTERLAELLAELERRRRSLGLREPALPAAV